MSLILSTADVAVLRDRHEEVRIRYSGRGMYGAHCVGYVGDDPALFAFDLAVVVAGLEWSEDTTPGDLRDELENLGSPCSDGMGLSTIWYWTRVTVGLDVEEPEE